MIEPVKVTYGYFPDPAEAVKMGWTVAQILSDCKRMPREALTPELRKTLLHHGLTLAQIDLLYKFTESQLARFKDTAQRTRRLLEGNKPKKGAVKR